jgi:hypothetical protein
MHRLERYSITFLALATASTAAVIVGLFPMPYDYYMLSRVVICLTAALGFARAVEREKHAWLWVFGAVAVLYNPVLPVRLGVKAVWVVLNLATLVLFWVGVSVLAGAATAGSEAPGVREGMT